jgi:hypothetical protein
MNDTPETDGEWNRIACYDHPQFEQGIAEFARKLERERDEWKAKYIQQNKDLGCELRDPNGTIWDHTKTLQRERDEAREETIRTREFMGCGFAKAKEELATMETRHAATMMHTQSVVENSNQLREQRDDAERQRDRLAEALRKLADCDWVITLPNRMDAVRAVANEALSSQNAKEHPTT